jgi:hypothetical protein
MKIPSHLKRQEAHLKEHIQQAVALMLLQSRKLQDRDMEAIGMPDDDSVSAGQSVPVPALVVQNCRVVDRACSVLPSDIIKNWIFDYESKLTSPRNFFDSFPHHLKEAVLLARRMPSTSRSNTKTNLAQLVWLHTHFIMTGIFLLR